MPHPSPRTSSRHDQQAHAASSHQRHTVHNVKEDAGHEAKTSRKAGAAATPPSSMSARTPFGTRNVIMSHQQQKQQVVVHRVNGVEKPASASHPQQPSFNRLPGARGLRPSVYASHSPSPLSLAHRQQQQHQQATEEQENGSLAPDVVRTPRKRAVPLEDVHCRNVVGGERGLSPNPHKRSRSSKNESSAGDASTSTSLGISAAINDVHLQSQETGAVSGEGIVNSTQSTTIGRPGKHERPTGHGSVNTTAKTVRIDKQSRLTQTDRLQRDQNRTTSTLEWRKRFLKAFPQFRFYLDGFDHTVKAEVSALIVNFGGHVEPFFSNAVSHLVTSRKVSLPPVTDQHDGAESASSASTSTVVAERISGTTSSLASRAMLSAGRFSRLPALRSKKSTAVPLHSERNPFDEWGPPVQANDILVKARSFGIKVWNYDKFKTVMGGLVGDVTEDLKRQPNLSQLLAKEKVQGTQERDPKAVRSDFHYFSRNSIYVLVEDATGEHRPIMAQEWRKPARDDETMPWPVLYGDLEGRCPFTKFHIDGDARRRMRPNRHETLQRSVSLNHVRMQQRNASLSPAPSNDSRGGYSIARGASPYPLASGNSVSIASTNITSTTSAAATNSPAGVGLMSPFHPLGRKAYPATSLGMGHPSSLPRSASASAALPGSATRGKATGSAAQTPAEHVRGSLVRRMLGLDKVRTPPIAGSAVIAGGMRRSVSLASTAQQPRREKKPGYCENCRMKYEDFDDHIVARRHRKFAQDDGNFAEIDDLLRRVGRPVAAWAVDLSSGEASEGEEGEAIELDDDLDFDSVDADEHGDVVEEGEDGDTYDDIEDEDEEVCSGSDEPLAADTADSVLQGAPIAIMANNTADPEDVSDWGRIAQRRQLDRSNHIGDADAAATAGDEVHSVSSPGAPSYGITIGRHAERSTASASPQTSPQVLPQDALSAQQKLTENDDCDDGNVAVTFAGNEDAYRRMT